MKNKLNYIKAFILLAFATIPNFATNAHSISNKQYFTDNIKTEEERIIDYISKKELFNYIAFKESSNKYNISNHLNMLGKYQASRSALLDFGYTDTLIDSIYASIYTDTLDNGKTRYYFDTSIFTPQEQERFIRWFVKKIEKVYLKETINDFVGQEIDGIYITKAGIIYASMLGFGHVKNFFNSSGDTNFKDAYGTSIKERLAEFESKELHS